MTDPAEEALGTFGLILNFGAIISTALWLSMIGGSSAGTDTALAGASTIVLFAASFICFGADRPTSNHADAAPADEVISSGRCPTAP